MTEKAHILAVDDDSKNHDILKLILTPTYDLQHAYSGEEALKLVEASTPDLILLDIMMPGIDGYEVCRRIAECDMTRHIPIVFVSAKESLNERLLGYEAGATDYFVKPFDHDELKAKIQRLLDMENQRKALAKRIAEAHSVAFQAMSNTSELGTILTFLENCLGARDYPQLCELLFATTRSSGLSCSVQIRDGGTPFYAADSGVPSPMEESVLEHVRSKGRIFDFKQRTVVNFPHISLLIKNMPLENPERYGQIKDNICFLMSGADARIRALIGERNLELQKKLLVELIAQTHQMLEQLNDGYKQLQGASYTIVEEMSERINDVVPRLGLEEYQESSIFQIAEQCVAKTRALYDSSALVNQRFGGLVKQISEVTGSGNVEPKLLLRLLETLR